MQRDDARDGDFKTQLEKMRTIPGYCGAGSKRWKHAQRLARVRIKDDAWSDEEQMFAIVHQMRTRI